MRSIADLVEAQVDPLLEPLREQTVMVDGRTPILALAFLDRCAVVERDGIRQLISFKRLFIEPERLHWGRRESWTASERHQRSRDRRRRARLMQIPAQQGVQWSEIKTECGGDRAWFVAVFRKYEGQPTDAKDVHGRVVTVSVASFAQHLGINRVTFARWVKKTDKRLDEQKFVELG